MADASEDPDTSDPPDDAEPESLDALRRRVEEMYDFENFGPADMAKMTLDEWEVAFDPDTWIVGEELIDRVERDLLNRIATRDVFAVVERVEEAGQPRLLAFSDEGYAVVYPDGSVEGEGTVLRDVEPTVVLCSMEDYEVPDPPADVSLPGPESVAEGTGEFGNLMLQVIAAAQILAGLGLLVAWLATDVSTLVAPVAAFGFLLIGLFLFVVVANARLSDRFRAEEYRDRLRAIGLEGGERPAFVPFDENGVRRATPSLGDDERSTVDEVPADERATTETVGALGDDAAPTGDEVDTAGRERVRGTAPDTDGPDAS